MVKKDTIKFRVVGGVPSQIRNGDLPNTRFVR